MQDIAEQTGEVSPLLRTAPRLPVYTAHIWTWFCDLGRTRRMGFSALESISWAEVEAYFKVIDVKPLRWEVEALISLDSAFMESRTSPDKVASAKEVFGKGKNG